ncbi:MAG: (2Fe-2S)-binding protein [Methylobacter sp.]|jgi:bacterioferritin-associated ferredoxin|nr:(2Fe-2S)-binding protein [Methylobacter sp.]
MNDINPNKKQDVICHCSGTTKAQIKELVNNGIDNLDGISRATGACSGCGACDISILELLAENIADCGAHPT